MKDSIPPFVFVSYSRADLRLVMDLSERLRGRGCQTWVDVENLRPGDTWKAAIESALHAADAMVLIVSRKSVESVWTSVEVRLARGCGLRIIPILIEPVALSELPDTVTEFQVLNLNGASRRTLVASAADAVAACLGLAPRDDPAPATAPRPLWIEAHPKGVADPWHHQHEPHRPVDSLRLRLDVPFDPVRWASVMDLADTAPRATLLLPRTVASHEAVVLAAALSGRVGPERVQVVTDFPTDSALHRFAPILQIEVLSQVRGALCLDAKEAI
ncbi:toll/interleukin-1 receptor domain-containing protein [Tateyamaria armeniaca]|uniref:Toll/interleukin-1 receptor domain-containing protein n=1 Tax=Tateyamaria armeniaca TaxID=2518930 RepID=A0ABW8UMK8_9RHOB